METLEGRAVRVSSTVDVSGGQKYTPVSTTHMALFQLGSRSVTVSSDEPVLIGEGDDVLVAGVTRRGAFDALAYKNLSTRAEGDQGYVAALALGLILAVLGLSMLSFGVAGGLSRPLLVTLVGAGIAVAGFYFSHRGTRVLAARTLLRRYR